MERRDVLEGFGAVAAAMTTGDVPSAEAADADPAAIDEKNP
jgi:hypothetical protein